MSPASLYGASGTRNGSLTTQNMRANGMECQYRSESNPAVQLCRIGNALLMKSVIRLRIRGGSRRLLLTDFFGSETVVSIPSVLYTRGKSRPEHPVHIDFSRIQSQIQFAIVEWHMEPT